MLPVSPNEPKERTTGATDAQIEAAARRCWEAEMSHEASETWNSWRDYLIADLSNPASYIVPPGMVIAPAADVLTAEMRAERVERLMRMVKQYGSTCEKLGADYLAETLLERESMFDAIRAIAEGGTK